MAIPTPLGSKPRTISEAFGSIRSFSANAKRRVQNILTASNAGALAPSQLVADVKEMKNRRNDLATLAQSLGASGRAALNAHAREEFWDASLDYVAEGTAMAAAISSFVEWVNSNMPTSGYTFPQDGDGVLTDPVFAAGSAFSVAMRAQLQLVLDTLD